MKGGLLLKGKISSNLTSSGSGFKITSRSFSTGGPLKLGLIPSDGIGKEVVGAAHHVLKGLEEKGFLPPIQWIPLEAGWETFQKKKKALPDETLAALKTCHGALFGSVSSPSHRVEGYSSPIIGMRKAMDLYANIRPINSAPVQGSRENVDIMIVRENTECLYVKQERLEEGGNKAVAERVITKKASTRIGEMAFKLATQRAAARKQTSSSSSSSPSSSSSSQRQEGGLVTIVHKSNVLSVSDGLFRESVLEVSKKFPQIQVEEQLVDSMVYKLILDPQRYDVVVAPNLYGDILSDAAAALVGGLGLAPSANLGDNFMLVEPVHGSAPDIAGKGIANPIATIRAAAMLIEFVTKSSKVPNALEKAIFENLKHGPRTPDLAGNSNTKTVASDILDRAIKILQQQK